MASGVYPRILGQQKPLLSSSSSVPYEHLDKSEGEVEPEAELPASTSPPRGSELAEGADPTSSSSSDPLKQGRVEFMWNGKTCSGAEIHKAALRGDAAAVAEIVAKDRGHLRARFSYRTVFRDIEQEGSGEAIHLAASRGHMDVVKLLLNHGVRIDAKVTRAGKDHYDVLNSAVFAEGICRNTELVRYLLAARAPLAPNSDGHWPLHIAFRTGSVEQIRLLRHATHDRGLLDKVEGDHADSSVVTPLMLGVQIGRMTEKQLAKAAAHTPASLRTFIEHEPRCIPAFLQGIQESHEVSAASLAAHLTGCDLAKVIRESPQAACALLDGVLEEPVCEGVGWHSLPSRVSFAPHGTLEVLRYLLNPSREILVFYEKDSSWKYDVAKFEAPQWHQNITAARGKPIRDCTVKVCHVPGILGAQFFSALGACSTEDYDEVFKNPVVNGSVEYMWWQGACKVDMMQVVLSLWGLVLLIVESWLIHDMVPRGQQGAPARQLRPHGGGVGGAEWVDGMEATDFAGGALIEISVAADFIGAKGVVDFFHELLQFFGDLTIGRGRDYLNVGNAWDLFRAAVLMTLFFDRTSQVIRVMVIFICWMRLLDVFTSAEKIAAALLPIKRSANSLLPVLMVTLVSFCAIMHAFHFIWGESHDWQEVVFRTFSTLITTELPAQPEQKSAMELLLTYGAVIFFSIFILNIFIGVIGQQYEHEKERVTVSLKHERAQCCLNFLLRACVLPCGLWSRKVSVVITFTAAAAAFWVQLAGLDAELGWGFVFSQTHSPTIFTRCMFAFLQFMMILAQYQKPNSPWARTPAGDCTAWYLWLVLPIEEECEKGIDMECSQSAGIRRGTFRDSW